MQKTWRLRECAADESDVVSLAERLGVSELIVSLLRRRGLKTVGEMDVFLSPTLRHLSPPAKIPGLQQAAEALARGLAQGKKFAVWGDYDVDGVTSTALVLDFMRKRGIEAMHHIPNRLEEGYGMNVEWVEKLAAEGIELILTVDCGITSKEEIARAKELGVSVVVSDHHLPGETLPEAEAICDPRLGECPCPDLAGVGVAFYLMSALNRLLPGQPLDMRQFLDLVALGTLADVVKLAGDNRILVKNGMLLIKEAARPGIFALKEAAGYKPLADLGAGQIVFGLAPRINAAGRLGQAEDALQMLLSPDRETARPLAQKLDTMNEDRRRQEEEITEAAIRQAEAQPDRLGLVLYDPGWHPGVIGIVASRIVERFYKPTLILTQEKGVIKGSGRSIKEFDLHKSLCDCEDILLGFGGHKQAAGLSLDPSNLPALRDRFHEAVIAQVGQEPLSPSLKLDAELPFQAINHILLKELELLQPFGMGNPEPVFQSPSVDVSAYSVFGKNHVRLQLRDRQSNVSLRAKAWRMAEALPQRVAGKAIRVAFTPKIDTYNGIATIELNVKDWHHDS